MPAYGACSTQNEFVRSDLLVDGRRQPAADRSGGRVFKPVQPEQGGYNLAQDGECRERVARHPDHRFAADPADNRRFARLYRNPVDEHLTEIRNHVRSVIPCTCGRAC